MPNLQEDPEQATTGRQTSEPPTRARALTVVQPPPPARRRARADAAAAQVSTLRDAIENLRYTVRFLEELMASRQAEADRAMVRTGAELGDLRQRIIWVQELVRSRQS
jgi:CHAD domain-containing protein